VDHGEFWGSAREHTVDTWGSAGKHREDTLGVRRYGGYLGGSHGGRKDWIWQTSGDIRQAGIQKSRGSFSVSQCAIVEDYDMALTDRDDEH